MEEWLQPTRLIDCGHPRVVEAAGAATEGAGDAGQKALLLYFFVRDAIKYGVATKFDMLKASEVLELGYGGAIPKTTLFVALLRACRIPARMRMVSLNFAVNAGYGMPDNVYGDHAYTEVFLEGMWIKLDSYIIDSPLYASASSKIKTLGWAQGYGVHAQGANEWDGFSDSFVQYVAPAITADEPRGARQASFARRAAHGARRADRPPAARAPRCVLKVSGELRHSGAAGVHRDMPQTDADFGVVVDMEDFKARVKGSPFEGLRSMKMRVPLVFMAAGWNKRIAAARAGK
ncbi:MAG: hypothetical protein J3K34DRAFT_521102 [Monoraphidium minutum]|nr:MAG: hypothetical protein J3K34DRAFT_521102 [Monoraphidium minutum]